MKLGWPGHMLYKHSYFFNLVICKLEGSGKWPEDLEAICRLKAAYYVKLGQILAACHQLMVDVSPTHLDVLKVGLAAFAICS